LELTRALAENIVRTGYEDLSDEARAATKRSILDTLAVMFPAAGIEKACSTLSQLVREIGGKGESTLLTGGKAPCWMAALVNGSLTHALDYDDGIENPPHHPTACTFPAVLAVAERLGRVSGREFITAVALGNDLAIRLASGPTGKLVEDYPWFPITTFGVFSALAGAGKLLGLSEEQMVNGLGIALNRVSGIMDAMAASESEIRAIRDGFSNQEGVLSALMASKGIAACKNSVEILYKALYRNEVNRQTVTLDLGKKFRGTGVHLKPWPACRETHGHIQAALEIVRECQIDPREISEVILTVGNFAANRLCAPLDEKRSPTLSIGSKFSLPFAVAVALTKREVRIADFLTHNLGDPQVASIARRVSYRVDASFGIVTPAVVEVRTFDGRVVSKRVERVLGDPESPLSDQDLIAKFRDCVRYAPKPLSAEKIDALTHNFLKLEEIADMREITTLLEVAD
jgi:2-methylcitrate dehydratase PrpD